MSKKGFILIFSLLITVVLAVLVGAAYLKSTNEAHLAKVFVASSRAFWLAEAGIAHIKANPGLSAARGSIGDPNYTFDTTVSRIGLTRYYTVSSTGSVLLPSGIRVSRTITVTVETGATDPSKFQYAVETTTDLEIKGSAQINPPDSWREYSTIDFANLFGISKTDMRSSANNLFSNVESFDMGSANQITWLDVSPGCLLDITGGDGSGILIINGNVKIRGNTTFNGIIYVIGELTMMGTPIISGSVLAESRTTVDTYLGGNVVLNYDIDAITNSLSWVQFLTKNIVSWRES